MSSLIPETVILIMILMFGTLLFIKTSRVIVSTEVFIIVRMIMSINILIFLYDPV